MENRGFPLDLSRFRDLPGLIDHLKNSHTNLFTDSIVGKFGSDLLIAGAILILAEKVDKLATTGVSLTQAQTDLTTAMNQLGTDLQNAINVIKNGNPNDPQVAQAAAFIETAAGNLQAFDASVQSAVGNATVPPVTGTDSGSQGSSAPVAGAGTNPTAA